MQGPEGGSPGEEPVQERTEPVEVPVPVEPSEGQGRIQEEEVQRVGVLREEVRQQGQKQEARVPPMIPTRFRLARGLHQIADCGSPSVAKSHSGNGVLGYLEEA